MVYNIQFTQIRLPTRVTRVTQPLFRPKFNMPELFLFSTKCYHPSIPLLFKPARSRKRVSVRNEYNIPVEVRASLISDDSDFGNEYDFYTY